MHWTEIVAVVLAAVFGVAFLLALRRLLIIVICAVLAVFYRGAKEEDWMRQLDAYIEQLQSLPIAEAKLKAARALNDP